MSVLFREKRLILFIVTIFLSHVATVACEKQDLRESVNEEEEQVLLPEEIVVFDSDTLKVLYYNKMEDWHNMQGGAIYKDKLVCIMATDEMLDEDCNGFIYDITTGKKISGLHFLSALGGKTYAKPHANQVSFGSHFYDENSDFPLLYVSQVNGGSTALWAASERGVLVYNLERSVVDGVITYNPVLVQAIVPDLTDIDLMKKIGKYTPNYIVDTDNNQMVVIGYPNESWYNLSGPQPIAIFSLPSFSRGKEIVLTSSEVVDSFFLPESEGIQQSFYKDGKLYVSGGFWAHGTIRIIDLAKRDVITKVELDQFTNKEPQFFGNWRNRFLYYEAGTEGQIYEFVFK